MEKMQETDRFVKIFGNFGALDNETIEKFKTLNDEKMTQKAILDEESKIWLRDGYALPTARPLLQSQDGSFSILIGSGALTFRESREKIESDYDAFLSKALTYLETIKELEKYHINRIAVTGSSVYFDESISEKIAQSVGDINIEKLREKESWHISLTDRRTEKINKAETIINSIIVFGKNPANDNIFKKDIIFTEYDYNTAIDNKREFSEADIRSFLSLAKKNYATFKEFGKSK